jgi:hypothetical protein
MDCSPQGSSAPGKALKVLLKNGLLFQRMLVRCTPLLIDRIRLYFQVARAECV